MDDQPIEDEENDILNFTNNAKQLAKKIESLFVEKHSFSIGIIGEWGSGKTSYLNLVKCELKQQNERFIIVDFNPRNSKSTGNIQADFFELLFSKLKQYDLCCSLTFQKYLQAIGVHIDNQLFSFLLSLQGTPDKDSEKEKIKEAILRLNKKIVVIIEDFDRLLRPEILEVFKLIDGNASFANVIFILAYDKEQLHTLLEYNRFSEKFVTWEHPLPVRPYDKILNYFKSELFERIEVLQKDEEMYINTLKNYQELLTINLPTIRDIKRFLNIFVVSYNQIKNEVEFRDYLLLTIIKYKNYDEYKKLWNIEFIDDEGSFYCFNEDKIKNIKSEKIIRNLFPKINKDAHSYFDDFGTNIKILSIRRRTAFSTYFYDFVYDGIPIQEMDDILFNTKSDFDNINQWKNARKLNHFIDYLNSKNILNLGNSDTFERYIDILLYINAKYNDENMPYNKIKLLIMEYDLKQILSYYNYNVNNYKQMLIQKLKGHYPDYPYKIVGGFLGGIINNELPDRIIFSKDELLQIAKNSLDDLIQNDDIIKQNHLELLYSCIDSIDPYTRNIFLDKASCQKVHQLIEKHPAGYFENFVRLGIITNSPDYNAITCELFWKEIFGSENDFEIFLNDHQDDIPNFELVNNFWTLFKNNEYQMIYFEHQGNVQEKINNNLREERRQLEELLQIKQELSAENNRDYDEKYQKLLERLDNIKINIQLARELQNRITEIING
jgi:hypothetical protein